ncbi:unnamed protein product [Moneuplotes crassus]|uniref:Tubulin/FtsZ GTPase domain-containing protein n=1 Tax=Euplotes crassus TaxID=5936 RepID=A0AAD1XF49_EUPCR|nr:unnamed protein product [Moneuplotes crassus]
MKDIISFHVGNAGQQIGDSTWQLFCIEHGIQPDATRVYERPYQGEQDFFHSFFTEHPDQTYSPKAVFVDSEPSSSLQVSEGELSKVYSLQSFVLRETDTRRHSLEPEEAASGGLVERAIEAVRLEAEASDGVGGFIGTSSLCGFTGSKLNSELLQQLSDEYPGITKMQVSLYPCNIAENVTECYNCVLNCESLIEDVDLNFVMDNKAAFGICKEYLKLETPNLTNINRVIAQAMASITCTMRFDSCMNQNLDEMLQNLVPVKGLNFILTANASYVPSTKVRESPSTEEVTRDLFDSSACLSSCEPINGRYISLNVSYRGMHIPKFVSIALYEHRPRINYVPWEVCGMKCGICYNSPKVYEGKEMALVSKGGVKLANNTAVCSVFEPIEEKFDQLYSRRAFVKSYNELGYEADDFEASRDKWSDLIYRYQTASQATQYDLDD